MKSTIADKIIELKNKHNAVILAHYYQYGEIQDIADIVGDSLALAREAATVEADVIVFCGVHFMAETAAILNPDRKVILPDIHSGCPMADMCDARELRLAKQKFPDAKVVSYVNSSAEVKAESDLCCTSGNSVKVLSSISSDTPYIFVPDRWLGEWASRKLGRDNLFLIDLNGVVEDMGGHGTPAYLWNGYCPVHHQILRMFITQKAQEYPDAEICVHPECQADVIEAVDFVGSTAQIIKRVGESSSKKFIIGTEPGIIYALKKKYPDKEFIAASDVSICHDMKLITPQKLLWALESLEPVVTVESEIADRARVAIERMLELS
ncbi:MAG: quinolinate synthase NadA [Planctomycetota bacterium]|nr:quinolinate synthase NadA [Planctomycetota bacterium]